MSLKELDYSWRHTMNDEQREYMLAKAEFELAEKNLNDLEVKYIADNRIKNPDGSIPKTLWMMDDVDAFDHHVEIYGKIAQESGLDDARNKARDRLDKAEDALIVFGLSIAPESVRVKLAKGSNDSTVIREKFINTILKLDVSTL